MVERHWWVKLLAAYHRSRPRHYTVGVVTVPLVTTQSQLKRKSSSLKNVFEESMIILLNLAINVYYKTLIIHGTHQSKKAVPRRAVIQARELRLQEFITVSQMNTLRSKNSSMTVIQTEGSGRHFLKTEQNETIISSCPLPMT
jgi:hypothetical protein